ncbi:MAG: Gp15 family bacteriophage protein [Clostridia bacterium]|nr:Gp15 family bacteriophage protein [Clostridia bacterium]
MKVITGKLPEAVLSDGIYYPVNTDFRVWIKLAAMLEKDGVRAIERAPELCYTKNRPKNSEKAFLAVMDFFLCGNRTDKNNKNAKRLISFEKDEELIFSSFLSEYSIDLSKEKMHWWRFMSLLKTLGPDTALSRVMDIRGKNPSEIKNSAARRLLLKQKRIYAIEDGNEALGDVLSELFKDGGGI